MILLFSNYKQRLQLEIAEKLEVELKDVVAKFHNLRCQYNTELRKIKNKKSVAGSDVVYVARWEYFGALQFLSKAKSSSNISPILVSKFWLYFSQLNARILQWNFILIFIIYSII